MSLTIGQRNCLVVLTAWHSDDPDEDPDERGSIEIWISLAKDADRRNLSFSSPTTQGGETTFEINCILSEDLLDIDTTIDKFEDKHPGEWTQISNEILKKVTCGNGDVDLMRFLKALWREFKPWGEGGLSGKMKTIKENKLRSLIISVEEEGGDSVSLLRRFITEIESEKERNHVLARLSTRVLQLLFPESPEPIVPEESNDAKNESFAEEIIPLPFDEVEQDAQTWWQHVSHASRLY
jgi:hypothetical protein